MWCHFKVKMSPLKGTKIADLLQIDEIAIAARHFQDKQGEGERMKKRKWMKKKQHNVLTINNVLWVDFSNVFTCKEDECLVQNWTVMWNLVFNT